MRKRIPAPRPLIKWILRIIAIQLVLVNISAAIYAYRMTHARKHAPEWQPARAGLVKKSWLLFTGPSFAKDTQLSAPPFPVEQIEIKSSEGKRISAWFSGTGDAMGTVCIFHGLYSNRTAIIEEAAAFREMGFNILLADLTGHGRSDGNTTTLGYGEAVDVRYVFEYAKTRIEKPVILYGMSMGAVAIARAVGELGVRPQGVIMDMPFNRLLDHVSARGRSFGFPGAGFGFLVSAWMGLESGFPAFGHNTGKYAAGMECPVLLQWGSADHLVSRYETRKIFENIASPEKKLVIYPGAVHASLRRQAPGLWYREIPAFMNQIISGSGQECQ